MRLAWRCCIATVLVLSAGPPAAGQTALTWPDVRDRFRATNPTLKGGALAVDESRAAETTAYLRPNPVWSVTLDQVGQTQDGNVFSASNLLTAASYLHERQQQRELRLESAQKATAIAGSSQVDLDRTL